MAQTSLVLFWLGVALCAASTLAYLGSAFGARVRPRVAMTSAGAVTITDREPPSPLWARLGSSLALLAAAALLAMMVTRTLATGRPPYSNMFEYLTAFGAGVVIVVAIMERRGGRARVAPFAMPLALALFLVADTAFSPEIRPLVPALQNNRLLAVHVAAMLISYSIIAVAGVAATLQLVQGEGNRFARLPSYAGLQDATYKAVVAGFPILGLGIALGAYWGDIAWGRYWGWDPKETTALVSWLVLAGYLHAHSLARWRGNRAAWLVVVALASILFNIFVVNFVIAGLHSYAG
ncbi:MAG: cytochrome c biogenesis protein CcsA [Dehalococcoidia bacterium]